MNRLGPALEQLLAEKGVSQSALARRLDVTSSAVNGWVKGKSLPSRDNIERVEDELAVPHGVLLNLAGYSANSETPGPTVESLLRADPGLDPEDKRVLLRIIRMARERYDQAQQGLVEGEPGDS